MDVEVAAISSQACQVFAIHFKDMQRLIFHESLNFIVIMLIPRLFEFIVVFTLRRFLDTGRVAHPKRACRSATLDITIGAKTKRNTKTHINSVA